jgi:hypothetical protein
MPTDLTVQEFWGAIVVQRDEGDLTRRWWFDTTDEGRLVFTSRVDACDVFGTRSTSYDTESSSQAEGERFEERTYHDADDISVPRSVVEQLADEGFDAGIFSSDAKRYWTADEMRAMGET